MKIPVSVAAQPPSVLSDASYRERHTFGRRHNLCNCEFFRPKDDWPKAIETGVFNTRHKETDIMIRVGVIGYGYWGPNLVRNFQRNPGCVMARVADLNPHRLEVAQRDWPGMEVALTPEAITRADDIDAVVIATPICTHFDLALDALRHDKHVLVEKPMAHSVACCERLIEEAARRRCVLMVDHTFVYTEAVRWMRDFVATGNLGELYYLDSVRTNLGLFQHDASVIWDLAPHDLSVLNALTDRSVLRVSATGSCHAGSRVPDIAYLSLDLGDGVLAHIHVNWLSPVKVRRLMLAGSRRMVVFDDLETSEKLKVYDSGVSVAHGDETSDYRVNIEYRIGDMMSPALPHREALQTMAQHFLCCVAGEETPLTGPDAGLAVVRALEAAQRSIELGGEQVRL